MKGRTRYISGLLVYIDLMSRSKGSTIVIKTEKICGTDRRCSWAIYEIMKRYEDMGLATKWKKGTWVIDRKNIDIMKKDILATLPYR
ncbi:hypothetical protein [Thermoproteus tenax]|uniref:Helix-turn-helix domain-containing protein n=1 Tax=Thermoproteus tenax (strain ATCC 35583 / DSM 2078 / JCM 9277 / NBRC 100435 / Kra 1) TaxID=768679 RepID=G4RKS1_THETK|nr:hypothetical protein [Thermoproteus tenax]CCC82166.1 hypothetical protein TTX_1540 [Thermoproteus tenax Kra 1]